MQSNQGASCSFKVGEGGGGHNKSEYIKVHVHFDVQVTCKYMYMPVHY